MRRVVLAVLVGAAACGQVTVPADESDAPEEEKAPPAGVREVAPYPKVVWVREFDETLAIVDVVVARDGAIYVAADRSGGPPFFFTNPARGPQDRLAIARLTSDGVEEWRREFSGSEVHLAGLDVDGAGNAYLCGWASEYVDLGQGALTFEYSGIFAGKLDTGGATAWSTIVDSELAWTHGCDLTSNNELLIGVGMNFGEQALLGTKLTSEGEVAWSLVNHLFTTGPMAPIAAVGPDDTFYLYWDTGNDPVDFGDGVPRYGAPGLLASFSADNQLRWSTPTGRVMASSVVATSAGLVMNGMNLSVGDEATELFDVNTGESIWRWGYTNGPFLVETGWFEPAEGAWVVGTEFGRETYAFLAHIGVDEVETTRLAFGASTSAGALARVDERHLLVGGDYLDGTVIAGEELEGTGYFLALVETGP